VRTERRRNRFLRLADERAAVAAVDLEHVAASRSKAYGSKRRVETEKRPEQPCKPGTTRADQA